MRMIEGPLDGARGRLSSGPTPVIRDRGEHDPRRRAAVHDRARDRTPRAEASVQVRAMARARTARTDTSIDPSWRDYEAEANVFASELLMPRHLVAPSCRGGATEPRDSARDRARVHDVDAGERDPLRAAHGDAARRSTPNAGRSNGRRGAADSRWNLPKGKPLPRGSFAYECARSVDVDDRPQELDAGIWFDTTEKVEIVEHSAPVSEAGGVITLLWVPENAATRLWPHAD